MIIRRFLAPAFVVALLCSTTANTRAAAAMGEGTPARDLPAGGTGPRAATAATEFRETPVMAEETKLLVQWLEDIHYLNTPISEELFKKVVPQFMGYLDDQRMFFTASDETELRARFAGALNDQLRNKGSLTAAYTIFKVYRERAEERVAWVIAEPAPAALESQGDPESLPPAGATPAVGAAGTEVFTFKATAEGTAELKLEYRREFEPDVPAEKTFSVTVEIK